MNPAHHPDNATLASYAAGAIEGNFAVVVNLHVSQCSHCQQRVAEAEKLGALLCQDLNDTPLSNDFEARLFAALEDDATEETTPITVEVPAPKLPDLLSTWGEQPVDDLPWKRLVPGIRQIKLPTSAGQLYLLRIAPGTCLPAHGHNGSELTMVLSGSYSDEIGRFTPWSVADLDNEIDHQPIADRDEDCICLIATDAPLKFHGWVPRLLQNFMHV